MPTIDRITTTVFRLPLHGDLRWGKTSVLHELRHVLVQVVLSDGSLGVAEAPPRPTIYGETVHSITGIIEQELAPRLIGLSVAEPHLPELAARLGVIKNNHTAKGALDMAIHDAVAAHRGIPLSQYLGVTAERVQVSYILGIGAREEVLAEAQRVFQQGVRVLKVKVGRDWPEDIARLEALQALLGPAAILYVDANQCLSPEEAPDKLAQLAERGIAYCEEPLPVELVEERTALRQRGDLPLIADDSAFSLRDLQRELALDTFDILNIKTARTGYSESRHMLEAAIAAGKGVMVGSQASAGLGTVRAALFAGLPGIHYPCELSFFLKLKQDILNRPLVLHDGYLSLADLTDVHVDVDRLRDATVTWA